MKANGVGALFWGFTFFPACQDCFFPRLFGAPPFYPGSEPPWYFIRQDFFRGVGSFIGACTVLIILPITWRRYTMSNWLLLMMVAIWMVPSMVTSIVIYSRCADFFQYTRAVSYWPTFEAYSRSGIKFVGLPVAFGLALLIAGLIGWRRFRERWNVT